MRGLLLFVVILGSLPYCLSRPWIGVLVFSWISYMNPHRYAWGPIRTFPVALVVALVTIIGLALTQDRSRLTRDTATVLLVALWTLFTFTTFFAFNPNWAQYELTQVSKILLMTFVTLMLINNPAKLRYLLLVIALSVGLVGLKGGIWAIASGGANRVYGPEGSFLFDNNDVALAMNMTLPLLLFLSKDEPHSWIRWLLRACFGMSVVAIIFTYSRGGFVTMVFVGFMLLVKAKYKSIAVIALLIGLLAVMPLIPQKWSDRMDTISHGEEDRSAHGRINAWRTGLNIALDRPLVGGGFKTWTPQVFARYSPEPGNVRDVHSNYFEMLAEQGFIGLALYLMLLGHCLWSLSNLKSKIFGNPALQWAQYYPDMLQGAILAYMVGGAFLGRAYFDFFYHLVAATVILRRLVLNQLAASRKSPTSESTPSVFSGRLRPQEHVGLS